LSKKKLAVFVSGSGTNLENLSNKIREGKLNGCEIALVVSDNEKAVALERAKKSGLKSVVVRRRDSADTLSFEAKIMEALEREKVDFLVLAGFMRVLSPEFVRRYRWRIVNIHPALLPEFPGAHAISDAWEAGVRATGVTVHFVDEGVDTGPAILQRKISRTADDTLESLEEKIHALEYELYPQAVQLLVDGKLTVESGRVVIHKK